MNPFLEITRPKIWIPVAFFVFLGALLTGDATSPQVYAAMLSSVLIASGGTVINDFIDKKRDSIVKRHKPIPSGRVDSRSAFYYAVGLFLIGFIVSTYVSPVAIVLTFLNIIFLLGYSTHFRYYHVFGNFIISYLLASAFLIGGAATGNMLPAVFAAVFVILANTAREIMNDIESLRTDRAFGLATIPVLCGVGYSRKIASIFLVAASAVLFITNYYGVFSRSYIGLAVASVLIFGYSIYQNIKDKESEKVGYEITLGMVVGVMAFLAGMLL